MGWTLDWEDSATLQGEAGRGKRDSISELAVGSHIPRLLLASSFLIFPSLSLSFSL